MARPRAPLPPLAAIRTHRYPHFDDLRAVRPDPRPLANNLGRVNKVFQQLLVHARQGPAARALLLLPGALARLAHDTAGRSEKDVAVAELLLELTNKAGLDFVEGFEERGRDRDEDGLLAVANVELAMRK